MLVLGDLFKAIWFLAISVTIIANGGISSAARWCQFNGFAVQGSIIACGAYLRQVFTSPMLIATDYAVLIMSIHMYLQIFKPSSGLLGNDGLYRLRYYVYAGWLLLPCIDASLAFINPSHGYLAQGAFCSLPIRPYWYRLALTWVPRYLIWITIFAIAIRIYLHVGEGFKVFAREQDRSSSVDMGSEPASRDSRLIQTNGDLHDMTALAPKPATFPQEGDATPPTGGASIDWNPSFATPNQEPLTPTKPDNSAVPSRRGSKVAFQGVLPMDFLPLPATSAKRGSISTVSFKSNKSNTASVRDSAYSPTPVNLTPIKETNINPIGKAAVASLNSSHSPMAERRRLIQRQLRLLFIYPCVYLILWVIPFIQHSFNYSDYYAQHPVFVLALLSTLCQSIMGFFDCLVFSWREKPWRHIPGSDGSFCGSFRFWTFNASLLPTYHNPSISSTLPPHADAQNAATAKPQRKRSIWNLTTQPTTFAGSTQGKRWPMHRKTFSASSDRAQMAADRAAERLALERAEFEQKQEQRRSLPNAAGSKDWWDRELSDVVLPEEARAGVGDDGFP